MKSFYNKKSIITLIFCVLTSLCFAQTDVWDGTATTWTHGSGTVNDPYLIESAENLAYLAYRVNYGLGSTGGHAVDAGKYYKLMVDIDLNGSPSLQWTPIGYYTDEQDNYYFAGHFLGNNHVIKNLYINSATMNHAGLFGYAGDGSIHDLGIDENSSLILTSGTIGGIAAKASSLSVFNCYNKGKILSNENVVYYNIGYYDGGIIGSGDNVIIEECNNTGQIFEGGGIMGQGNGRIVSCWNSANIDKGCGIVGIAVEVENNSSITISHCYNTGMINYNGETGLKGCAGICCNFSYDGGCNSIDIFHCYNTGDITNGSGIGRADNISYCYNTGDITNGSGIGQADNISYCYNTGDITSEGNGSGIGGANSIHHCYNTGNVSGKECVGGIISCLHVFDDANISNCYNTGSISNTGNSTPYGVCAGGIVGRITIDNGNFNANISNCYNTGSISNTGNYSGGIVGFSGYSDNVTISNCYNVGSILEGEYKGGIRGRGHISTVVSNCHFLNTCGGNNEYGGMAKPSEIMRDSEFVTMLNAGGNNYVSDVIPNINDGYPLLEWQLYLGVDEIDNDTDCQLSIYPNPAKNRVTVSGEEIEEVSIYNITGQLVTKKMFIGKESSVIELNDITSGIYIFKITLKDGRNVGRRVVVEK